MHVIKVPVVHKFGIISHCQRLKLQSRLFEEIVQEKTDVSHDSTKSNPFEVSDEFVDNYNAVINDKTSKQELKRDILDKAQKMFNKIKRKIGIQYNCESEAHINLAMGWTELSILSQCNGNIGQESLDLLLMSLNVAPISNRAFSVLFYLLETVLYFVQVHKFDPSNPNKHIKWLLIGEIVSVRIYLQCVLKLCQNWKDKMENLTIYIKDFNKCQPQYEYFPELSISFCVIKEVTDYLIATCDDPLTEEEGKTEEALSYQCGSFLWHAVDLCRCFTYRTFRSQIPDCIDGIRGCISQNTSLGEWMDCYLAIRVVANVASFDESALDVFTSIISGLTDVNDAIVKQRDSPDEQFERGTLLLMTAMRELATLSLLASHSVVRERSLSTVAEILLSKTSGREISLPWKIRHVVVARIQAVLDICNRNENVSRFYVMKNSIWCLLGAIKRKRVMSASEDIYCEKYGAMLSWSLYSKDLHEMPQSANNRISSILIQHLFPVFPTGDEDFLQKLSEQVINKSSLIPPKKERPKFKMTELSKKRTPVTKKDSGYVKQTDIKLKSILNNYWNLDLPVLEKSLDEEQSEIDKK